MSLPDKVLNALAEVVGSGKLLTDEESLVHYGRDWSRLYEPAPSAIIFPKSAEEVQSIVKLANEYKFGLVPSGGRTGLSAGAVAAHGEVVVAFDYMNEILDFNASERSVRCQPGVVTEQLQNFAQEQNLFYPVDFASSGSSQLGGNISTNAGGIKVIRYGLTRDWVSGLKVVTGSGALLDLNKGLIKNATGLDLRHLFIGAEGSLGFIVEATMQLARQPKNLTAMVLGVPEFEALMQVLHTFQEAIDLTAFEFFSEKAVQLVTEHTGVARAFGTAAPYYALLEFELLNSDMEDQIMGLFETCVEAGYVLDGVMSQSIQQLHNLWRLREGISETLAPFTPYKNDISVTVSKVPAFLAEVDAVVAQHYPDFEIVWFGHIGDGNLHLNILKPAEMAAPQFFEHCKQVSDWIFKLVQKYEGSISAEHGVGLIKKHALGYSRSDMEIECMRQIKKVFDPNNVVNPGKLFDV